jgi:hypothetical protein
VMGSPSLCAAVFVISSPFAVATILVSSQTQYLKQTKRNTHSVRGANVAEYCVEAKNPVSLAQE